MAAIDGTLAVMDTHPIQLTVSMLSGWSTSVSLSSSNTVSELQCTVKEALQVNASRFYLLHKGRSIETSIDNRDASASTLKEVGLFDGADVVIAIVSPLCGVEVPPCFKLELTALSPCKSSAFIMRYNIDVELKTSVARAEKWRKSDHDTIEIYTQEGAIRGSTQHWMRGDSPFERPLGFSMPLKDLLDSWLERAEPVQDEADLFWKSDAKPGPKVRSREGRRPSVDWKDAKPSEPFKTPSDNCIELVVQADMGFLRLSRVLLGADLKPIRAAIICDAPNHDMVEEYNVTMQPNCAASEEATVAST
jgi:hypothetical protein